MYEVFALNATSDTQTHNFIWPTRGKGLSLRRLADSVVVTNRLFTIQGNVAVYIRLNLLKIEQNNWGTVKECV